MCWDVHVTPAHILRLIMYGHDRATPHIGMARKEYTMRMPHMGAHLNYPHDRVNKHALILAGDGQAQHSGHCGGDIGHLPHAAMCVVYEHIMGIHVICMCTYVCQMCISCAHTAREDARTHTCMYTYMCTCMQRHL